MTRPLSRFLTLTLLVVQLSSLPSPALATSARQTAVNSLASVPAQSRPTKDPADQPFWVKQEQRDGLYPTGDVSPDYLESRTFYDGLSQVIQTQSEGITNTLSTVASTQYNADGQPIKKNAPYFGAGLTTFQNQLPDFTNKPTTQTIYDALGRVKKVLAPDGTTYTEHSYAVTYNAGDSDFTTPRPVDYTIDANRHFVRRAYDAYGNLRIVSEAMGSWPEGGTLNWGTELRTRYTYDVEGQLTQVQDHLGNITTLAYDPLGLKASLNDRDMGLWYYGYDPVGNLTRQTDAKNQTTCLYYDGLNRIAGKVYQATTNCPASKPAIVAAEYTYDTGTNGIGRRASMAVYKTDGSIDNRASWAYDTRGRVTSETRTVAGVDYVEDMSYDAAGRVATLTYPPEVGGTREAISNSYDTAGQLAQVRSTTYNLNYATGLSYTAAGQLAEATYGNGTTERRGYYGLGSNWDSRPGAGLRNYGNLWRVRLTHNTNNVALFDLAWAYDYAGNVTRSNEAVTGAGSAWPTTYSFQDAFNSKNTSAYTWSAYQTAPFNDAGNNVVKSTGTGSNYDANFYRTSTLATGQGIQLRFKVDGTNTSAHFALETTDGAKRLGIRSDFGVIQLQYNDGAAGGGWRYPAELIKTPLANTWYVLRIVLDDTRGSYVEVYPESAPSQRASYQQYLPAGLTWRFHHWIARGTAYIDDYREFSTGGMTWLPDERVDYGYDALNRLTSATQASGANGFSQSYQYDEIGNLKSRSDVGTYTYPASGPTSVRPHAATSIGANYSYTYDANGNMASRREGAVTYTQTWDEENRLKTVSTTGHTVTYSYDADGQRVKKVEDGQTTVYLGNAYEKNVTANTVTTYYYAGPQRVAQRQGTIVSYFVGDNLGSTSLTTDANGVEVGRQKYFPFGSPRAPSGTLKTDYRFTGQRSEEAKFGSLYDYGARFYSPILGRFVSPDTVIPDRTNPQSLNRYTYVLNQPLNGTDPDGHCFPLCTALAGGVVGGLIGAASVALPQMIDNVRSGDPLMANIEPAEVGKAAAVGFVSGLISGATVGVGGTLLATVAVGAATNAVAGQAAIATDNLLSGRNVGTGMLQGGDLLRDGLLGAAGGLASHGVAGILEGPGSTVTEGIYEFTDLKAGKTYVGQSGNVPQRLEQHIKAGRLGRIEDAKVTAVKGGKFMREIAEQDRISQLGGTPGGKVSNKVNPIGPARLAAAKQKGLKYPVRR